MVDLHESLVRKHDGCGPDHGLSHQSPTLGYTTLQQRRRFEASASKSARGPTLLWNLLLPLSHARPDVVSCFLTVLGNNLEIPQRMSGAFQATSSGAGFKVLSRRIATKLS
jgi:hypothetical protein